jgi:hypothetical protein
VSFTDLFIGILFLFLILVAALMLMHQESVQQHRSEAQQIAVQIKQAQAKLDATAKQDAEHPPFRLAMVYNVYQGAAGYRRDWTFSRTVQVFRASNGLCLNNIILRNSLSFAWKPPVKAEAIPSADNQNDLREVTPCRISASGEHWNLASETGGVERTAADLYSGSAVLHKKDGDETVYLEYRVLGVYDDYFRRRAGQGKPKAPRSNRA